MRILLICAGGLVELGRRIPTLAGPGSRYLDGGSDIVAGQGGLVGVASSRRRRGSVRGGIFFDRARQGGRRWSRLSSGLIDTTSLLALCNS